MTSEKETTQVQIPPAIQDSEFQNKSMLRGFAAKFSSGAGNSLYQVGWLLAATIIAGGFNYLANVFVGKLLGPEEYGIFAALLAFSLILSAPMGVIQTIVANYSARIAATSSNLGKLGALLISTWRLLLPWAVGGALMIALISGLIAGFLQIPSRLPVILVGFSLIPIVLFPVVLGTLQGLQRFGRYGWGQITAAVLRLILGVGFILIGWGVSGALLGGVLAGFGAFLLGWWWLRDIHSGSTINEFVRSEKPEMGPGISRFSVIVILSMLGFMVLMNIDTIAVKSRFLPIEAGLYSAVATIGRVVLYVPTAVLTLMFPRVAGEHAQGHSTSRLAWRALLVTISLSCIGLLIFSIRPELIMGLLFGQQFLGEAALLVPYGIAMLLLAVVNVWMLYFLAVQEKLYTVFLLAGAISIILVLFTLQLSFTGVVWALTFCNGGLALAGGLLLWRRSGSENGS